MKQTLFLLLLLMSSCVKMSQPNETEVPEGNYNPIDGYWEAEVELYGNTTNIGTYRINRGRLIIDKLNGYLDKQLLKKGMVMAKDIHLVSKNTYSGTFLYTAENGNLCECDLTIKIQNNKSLVLDHNAKAKCYKDAPVTQMRLFNPQLDNKELFLSQHSGTLTSLGIQMVSEERVEMPSDYQYVSPGSVLTIERSRTIRHQVVVEENTIQKENSSYGGQINISALKAEASRSIAQELGKSTVRLSEQEETYRMSVVLDGNVSSKWKITWFDKVRKGVAKFSDEDGKAYTLPFQFTVSTELEARNAADVEVLTK